MELERELETSRQAAVTSGREIKRLNGKVETHQANIKFRDKEIVKLRQADKVAHKEIEELTDRVKELMDKIDRSH